MMDEGCLVDAYRAVWVMDEGRLVGACRAVWVMDEGRLNDVYRGVWVIYIGQPCSLGAYIKEYLSRFTIIKYPKPLI